jgi:hypothetical protein
MSNIIVLAVIGALYLVITSYDEKHHGITAQPISEVSNANKLIA